LENGEDFFCLNLDEKGLKDEKDCASGAQVLQVRASKRVPIVMAFLMPMRTV